MISRTKFAFYYARWRLQAYRLLVGLVGTLTLGFVRREDALLRAEHRYLDMAEDLQMEEAWGEEND